MNFHNLCRVKKNIYIFLRVWGSVNHLLFGLGGFLQLVPSIRHSEAIFLHDLFAQVTGGTSKQHKYANVKKCQKRTSFRNWWNVCRIDFCWKKRHSIQSPVCPFVLTSIAWGALCALFLQPRSFAASLLEIPREKSWRQWSGELARGTLEHILFCLSRSLSKRNCLKQIVYSKKMEQHSEEWILLVHIFLLRAKLHTKTYNKNSELIYDIKNLPAAGAYFLKSYVSHS